MFFSSQVASTSLECHEVFSEQDQGHISMDSLIRSGREMTFVEFRANGFFGSGQSVDFIYSFYEESVLAELKSSVLLCSTYFRLAHDYGVLLRHKNSTLVL